MGFPAVVVSGGYSLVEVHRLRIAVASLAAEHGLWVLGPQQLWPMVSGVAAPRLWSTGSVVMMHRLRCSAARGILVSWSGIELTSPALPGKFLPSGPPGRPLLRS